jgi:DNA-binding MarR family transcriptional regulator
MLNEPAGTGADAAADEIMDTLARLFSKAAAIEREPVDTGDGVLLFTSEIHLIDMAGRFPGENLSSLAKILGITKGAISQTVKKLVEKGYLERINPEGNNKTVFIHLTAAGNRAFHWHREYHAVVNARIAREIADLDAKDRERITRLLEQVEQVFDDCPRTRSVISSHTRNNHTEKT